MCAKPIWPFATRYLSWSHNHKIITITIDKNDGGDDYKTVDVIIVCECGYNYNILIPNSNLGLHENNISTCMLFSELTLY